MIERRSLRLHAVTCAAQGINFYELRDPNGGELPPFTAGAHLDVYLGNGMVRQYSLANPQEERRRYVLGVKRDARSRGGSAWIHEHWRRGDRIDIGVQRNNF